MKAFGIFNVLKYGQCVFLRQKYRVNGQLCHLSASKMKNKQNESELQINISFDKQEETQQAYKQRWQIEAAFRPLKSSEFNIQQTHLADLTRIEKLCSIVTVAFAWAYVVVAKVYSNTD